MNNPPCLIYTPCASTDEAKHIARALLEKRLIACANILPATHSLYEWQGELCEAQEVILLMKTQRGHWQALCEAITALHSYDTPCILRLPVEAGNTAFLSWLDGCLKPAEG